MNNGGDGTINSPVSFPPPVENCNFFFDFSFFKETKSSKLISFFLYFYFSDYTSLQLFLSCGQEVTIYSRPVGYSDSGPPASGLPMSNDFSVNSWTNDLEDDFFEAQVYSECSYFQTNLIFIFFSQNIINSSPEVSLESNFDFVILQTMSLPCFLPETFTPLQPQVR